MSGVCRYHGALVERQCATCAKHQSQESNRHIGPNQSTDDAGHGGDSKEGSWGVGMGTTVACPHCEGTLSKGVVSNPLTGEKGYGCRECETVFSVGELRRLGVLS